MFTIDLSGRNAIVTGAGSGLGKQTALSLAGCGANIVAADINLAGVEETAAEVQALGCKALAVECDVTSYADYEALFDAAKAFGRVDIVINAAGIGPMTHVGETGEALFRKILDVNLIGVEFGSKLALNTMKAQGGGGVVINFASVAAFITNQITPHYCASKAAVVSLTHQYALAAAPLGIRFNSMCPGIIRTPMWESGLEQLTGGTDMAVKNDLWDSRITKNIPMGVPQEPIDIANAVVFLVSDQARYITGQSLCVDGGQVMH